MPSDSILAVGQAASATANTAQAIVFWLFALITVCGAIFTITRRNAVTAVMCLVGTLISLAVLFAMLYAHFLAIIQVLVYAGAVMVLFVFVVMILNKEEEEPWATRGLIGKGLASVGILYVVSRLVTTLWDLRTHMPTPVADTGEFGTTKTVGRVLFSDYLFPFEAVSLVLLIAVVGALVLGHPFRETHLAKPPTPGAGGG